MRSHLLSTFPALLLVGAACAQGSSPLGIGGFGTGAGATTVSTGPSMSTPASSSGGPATSSGSSAPTSSSTSTTSGGTCSDSPCKLTAPQCGCPSGQECTIASFMRACAPSGTATQGQACTGTGSCAPGLLCVGGGTTGVCDMFCSVDMDCSATGGICALTLSDGTAMGSIPNATLCSGNCNVITSSGCPLAGTGCQLGQEQTGQMRWLSYCASAGSNGSEQTCASASDCLPGYGCLNNGVSDVCLQYCDTSDINACGGLGCGALTDANSNPIVIHGVTLGACP